MNAPEPMPCSPSPLRLAYRQPEWQDQLTCARRPRRVPVNWRGNVAFVRFNPKGGFALVEQADGSIALCFVYTGRPLRDRYSPIGDGWHWLSWPAAERGLAQFFAMAGVEGRPVWPPVRRALA